MVTMGKLIQFVGLPLIVISSVPDPRISRGGLGQPTLEQSHVKSPERMLSSTVLDLNGIRVLLILLMMCRLYLEQNYWLNMSQILRGPL